MFNHKLLQTTVLILFSVLLLSGCGNSYVLKDLKADESFEGTCKSDLTFSSVNGSIQITGLMVINQSGEIVPWCNGATHTWMGNVTYNGYVFNSDENSPLQFRVEKDSYVYTDGSGTITLPDGSVVSLPIKKAHSSNSISVSPTEIPLFFTEITVDKSDNYACALTSEGGVMCWGRNNYGQLGNGTTQDSSIPVDVLGLTSGVKAISAGGSHVCALTIGGGVMCWGYNSNGQLGNGTRDNSSTPEDVSGLTSGIIAISAEGDNTCALTSNGAVKCWGFNKGVLGDPSIDMNLTPIDVDGLTSGIASVTTGWKYLCVLTSDGGVQCMGSNQFGILGHDTGSLSSTPVNIDGLTTGITALSAGYDHVCLLTSIGVVKCWGDTIPGAIGNPKLGPVDISELPNGFSAISVSGIFSCGITSVGGVKCWGENQYGNLGNGGISYGFSIVDVSGLTSGVAAISTGGTFACALSSVGKVYCWGDNTFGQLGDGTNNKSLTPVEVTW
jgi:alpha-tubulin suppressor-like RCC1 family protein